MNFPHRVTLRSNWLLQSCFLCNSSCWLLLKGWTTDSLSEAKSKSLSDPGCSVALWARQCACPVRSSAEVTAPPRSRMTAPAPASRLPSYGAGGFRASTTGRSWGPDQPPVLTHTDLFATPISPFPFLFQQFPVFYFASFARRDLKAKPLLHLERVNRL